MRPNFRLAKIAGVDVGIHYSFFVILALVSWSLASGFLPDRFYGWGSATYWATGVAGAVLLFVSVLVHELAHSLVAKSRGFPVEGITLFLLGGVSNLKAESRDARDEFIIAAVGPLTSIALSSIFVLVLLAFREDFVSGGVSVWYLTTFRISSTPVAAVVWYIALLNLLLAGFNLLPAFPLDGGRVLRSVIWGVTGSLPRATKIAARGGQVVGLALIGLGVYEIFQGFLGQGLWAMLIGWFLHNAANNNRREVEIAGHVSGVEVRDVMDDNPATIGPDVTVFDAGARLLRGRPGPISTRLRGRPARGSHHHLGYKGGTPVQVERGASQRGDDPHPSEAGSSQR